MADLKKHARTILKRLRTRYPDATCALRHRSPFELLIATILSAQCTDERVNRVTEDLFSQYRGPRDYLDAPIDELERAIYSTGFYRNKAKNIVGACQVIVDRYEGRVPDSMDDLLALPGVARKTANVVLGTAFGRSEGVVVDTHVGRLSRRLGLTDSEDPVKIEKTLMELFPRQSWVDLSHMLILHGRQVCTARSPKCHECFLSDICPSSTVDATTGKSAR